MEKPETTNESNLELTLEQIENISNPNLREIALKAWKGREHKSKDTEYPTQGNYSESYTGESY